MTMNQTMEVFDVIVVGAGKECLDLMQTVDLADRVY